MKWAIIITVGMILFGGVAEASNVYLSQERISDALDLEFGYGPFAGSCATCHAGPPMLNMEFGMDFAIEGNGRGNMSVAQLRNVLAAIADLDSDGDGYTNEEEYFAESDPGDAVSVPMPDDDDDDDSDPIDPPDSGDVGPPTDGNVSKQGGLGGGRAGGNQLSGGCGMRSGDFAKHEIKRQSEGGYMEAMTTGGVIFITLLLPLLTAFLLRVRIQEH